MSVARSTCRRCQREVVVEYQYPRLRHAGKIYLAFPLFLLPLFPFLAADYVVSLPAMMLWALGTGPVLSIVREKPTCIDCGAFVGGPTVAS